MGQRDAGHVAGIRRTARVLAVVVAILSLGVAALYLARTRAVLGPLVRSELNQVARARGATLEVEDMRPAGIVGVALEDVHLETDARGHSITADVTTLEVQPDIWAALTGRFRIGEVRASDGHAEVDLGAATGRTDLDEPTDSDDAPETATASTSESSASTSTTHTISIALEDVGVRVRRQGIMESSPVEVRHASFRVEQTGDQRRLTHAAGYGWLSGDVSYTLGTQRNEEGTPTFVVRPTRRVSLTRLAGESWPVDVRAGRVSVCLECRRKRLCAREVTAEASGHRIRTSSACLERGPEYLRTSIGEIDWRREGRRVPIRLRDIEGRASPGFGSGRVGLTAVGRRDGRADVSVDWSGESRVAEVTLEAESFRTGAIWPMLGVDSVIRGGRLDGEWTARLDLPTELVEIRGNGSFRTATVDHPFLDNDPVEIDGSRMNVDLITDFSLEHISLVETKLALGDLTPARVSGSFIDVGRGWSFALRAAARDVRAPALVDALPDSIASPAAGARLEGRFEASLSMAGHTAYPRSLRLDVDFGGDVEVLRESPRVDVPSLALTGPPGPTVSEGSVGRMPLSKWVLIDQLPDSSAEVLLAAEDTRFHRHSGFDWRGIRNAMVHNLKVGRLERGGSTISQQVAKNLFFTHRRTLSRKIREMWATWRLEDELSKDRILELYLNMAEWGPGVRGLHEAADAYFDSAPEALTLPQMTLLSAIIPGPRLYGSSVQAGYLPSSRVEKIEHILSNLRYVDVIDQTSYERIYDRAKRGRIGGLELTVCRDDEHAPASAPTCRFVTRGRRRGG